MFASAFNNPAFQRRKAEEKKFGSSAIRVTPMSFKQGLTHEIRLLADPKLPNGYHFNTVHKLEITEDEIEKVLCTESQEARKDLPCPCCQWYDQFSLDEVEVQEDGSERVIRRSLRSRLLASAQKNERIAPDIMEVVAGADKLSIYDSRTIVFVGIARNAEVYDSPNKDGGEPWKNIGPGSGYVTFHLNCSGKDEKFFMQIDQLMAAMLREGAEASDLVSPEYGAWLNYTVGTNYQKTITMGKREPLTPDVYKLISGPNFPNVAKFNQNTNKGGKGANLVHTYDTTCSKIARCSWYKKLHSRYTSKLTEEEVALLNIENYQESTAPVDLED